MALSSATSFSSGTLIQSSQVNTNFSTIISEVNAQCAFLAASQTFTGNQTINPSSGVALTITDGGITVTAGGVTVSADGITVTGNSTITGTLGGVTTLTCTTVTATNLGGTLTTAAQTGITSVGTLTALTCSGNLTLSASASQIIGGATSFAIRNNGNSANNILVTDAGVVTVRSHLNVTGSIGGNGSSAVAISGTTVVINNSSGLITLGTAAGGTTSTTDIPGMPAVSGAPSGAVSDGAFMLDSSNHRLYVRSGSTWKYAALT